MSLSPVKPLIFIVFLSIVASAIYAWYARAGGDRGSDARHYAAQYDAEKDDMGRCAMADLAGHYFGKISDRKNFEKWVSLREAACEKAGVTAPAPRFESGISK